MAQDRYINTRLPGQTFRFFCGCLVACSFFIQARSLVYQRGSIMLSGVLGFFEQWSRFALSLVEGSAMRSRSLLSLKRRAQRKGCVQSVAPSQRVLPLAVQSDKLILSLGLSCSCRVQS